jgi:hypothetical protein
MKQTMPRRRAEFFSGIRGEHERVFIDDHSHHQYEQGFKFEDIGAITSTSFSSTVTMAKIPK